MTYAVSAWWGYTTAADKQRLEALLRRAVRVGLYPADGPNLLCQLVTGIGVAMLFLREYRRMNIMYYNDCYPPQAYRL